MANANYMVFSTDEEGRNQVFRGPRMLDTWPPLERVVAIAHRLDEEGLISVVSPEEFQKMLVGAQSRDALESFADTYIAWDCTLLKSSQLSDEELEEAPHMARGASYLRGREVKWKIDESSPAEPSSTASGS